MVKIGQISHLIKIYKSCTKPVSTNVYRDENLVAIKPVFVVGLSVHLLFANNYFRFSHIKAQIVLNLEISIKRKPKLSLL